MDKYENRGGIYVYISGSQGEREMDDAYIQAYSPSNVYPDEDTRDRRVWVGDLPPGTYTIRAELWNWKLAPGTSSEYMKNALVATDQISITIPSKPGDTPDDPIAWPTATSNVPLLTQTVDLPQPPAGIDPGAIYVSSNPGNAEIWINGRYMVDTNSSIDNPFGFTNLAPGAYTVTLRKQGYIDYTEVINLNSYEIYDVKAVMQPGTTPTGWIIVNTDPLDVRLYLNDTQVAIAPTTLTDVPPGTYNLRLKKDGYEDWYDTVTVTAGQITEVYATLPAASGGFPIGAVAGGAAVIAGGGLLVKKLTGRGKGAKAVTQAPKSLYQQWWDKATPEERKNWDGFETFMRSRMGAPRLNKFVDVYGKPSWASAHESWAQEVKRGETKASFEEWVNAHAADQEVVKGMKEWAERNKDVRDPGIVEASKNYSEALRNKERFERLKQIKDIVANDSRLSEFASDASNIIVKDGIVDANKLARLENDLKYWIVRDKLMPQTPDYTYSDAYFDTVKQGSRNIFVRVGAAYVTGGYSEMALNPISAVSSMRDSIMQGDSTAWAVTKGFAQSGAELALGESGRLIKYAKPLVEKGKETYNMYKLGKVSSSLKTEISTVNQLASQGKQVTRNAFMKTSEVTKVGQTASHSLSHTERTALELNNNPEFRKLLAENSELIPNNVKEVMGVAKQKVYEQARNEAAESVLQQMAKDGVPAGDKAFLIKQTGTHAQPGNPGWNPLKSDFDHTVEFGSSKYNQLYESKFNSALEAQGTSAKAMDANVYQGTTGPGAYEGGALKFVEHYNETSGSDVMIRSVKGVTNITRETPQTSTSLLSRMNANDVKTAELNYQKFFAKDVAKGGDLNNQIVNGSKTVSRNAGQYSTKYVENFQKTGGVKYEPPPAAKVADLVKKRGFTVDNAMKKVGYNGSKEQLLNDYKKIMGM